MRISGFLVYWGCFLARFKRIVIPSLLVSLLVLAACAKAVPINVVKVVPPPLPHIEHHVEPLVTPIPTQLPKVNFNDPIDLAILEAQLRFERGENLYENGFLKQAKEEFD